MFCLFICFSLSTFIPFEKTFLPAIQQLNEITFPQYRGIHSALIALIIPDSTSSYEDQAYMLTLFASIIPLYSNVADFAFFKASESQALIGSVPVDPPCVVFFFKGRLSFTSQLPSSETTLAYLVGSWLDPDSDVCNTKEDLYGSLYGTPLALIARESLGINAHQIVTSALPYIGPCIVVRVKDHLMNEITGHPSNEKVDYALFRLDDHTIVPLKGNTTQIIYNATKPYFSELTDKVATTRFDLLGVFVDKPENMENYNEKRAKLLMDLALKYENTDIRFVMATKNSQMYVDQIIRQKVTGPNFYVISYYGGYYYPNDDKNLKGVDIASPNFQKLASSYIDDIINHKVEPKYFSEPEPTEEDKYNGAVQKLVGTTYPKFVENTQKDTLVLYYDNIEKALPTIKLLNDALTSINMSKNTNLLVGSINIGANSSPIKYPLFVNIPHVQLIPAKNKSDFRPMFYSLTKDNFLRFINESMTLPHSFETPKFDDPTAQMELVMFTMRQQKLPPIYNQKALAHLKMLESITGFDKYKEQAKEKEQLKNNDIGSATKEEMNQKVENYNEL